LIRSEPMNIDIKIPPRHITGSTPGVRYRTCNNKNLGSKIQGKRKNNSIFQAIKFHSRGFPSGANDGIYDIAGWTPLINVGRRRACCIKSHCTHKTLSYCWHCELRILTESEKVLVHFVCAALSPRVMSSSNRLSYKC